MKGFAQWAPVAFKALRDARWALLGWGLGLGALGAFTVAFYPSVAQDPALNDYWESLPDSVKNLFGGVESLSNFADYMNSQFLYLLPVLLGIVGIQYGTRAFVGEEDAGTIDLVLSQPVHRWRFALEKSAAALALAVILASVCGIALVVTAVPLGIDDATPLQMFVSCLNVVPVAWVVTASTLFASAAAHRKGVPILVGTGVLVFSYFLNAFALIVEALGPLRFASVFYYLARGEPLEGHLDGWYYVVGFVATSVLLVGTVWVYGRKDLTT